MWGGAWLKLSWRGLLLRLFLLAAGIAISQQAGAPGVAARVGGMAHRPAAAEQGDGGAVPPLQRHSKIVTWNVNGLAACIKRMGKSSLKELLESLGEDVAVVCVQETKIYFKSNLDQGMCKPEGWDAFYTVSKKKQGVGGGLGYSGVATFCRQGIARPVKAEEGFTSRCSTEDIDELLPESLRAEATKWVDDAFGGASWCDAIRNTTAEEVRSLDAEGRVLMTDHGDFCLFNCYFPAIRMTGESLDVDRLLYKLRFNYFFQQSAQRLRAEGKKLVVVGDLNIALEQQDRADSKDSEEDFNASPSRIWMKALLHGCGLVDTFRVYFPDRKDAFTMWSMYTGARLTNYGSRLDYILADASLVSPPPGSPRAGTFTSCDIHGPRGPHELGSDHCFVYATYSSDCIGVLGEMAPALCACYLAEARARQQNIKQFLAPKTSPHAQSAESSENEAALTRDGEDEKDEEGGVERLWGQDRRRDASGKGGGGGWGEGNVGRTKRARQCQLTVTSFFTGGTVRGAGASQQAANTGLDPTVSIKPLEPFRSQEGSVGKDERGEGAVNKNSAAASAWSKLFNSPKESKTKVAAPSYLSDKEQKAFLETAGIAPICKGHKEACILRIVSKKGPNVGRKFWVCARPNGKEGDLLAKCDTFSWA